MEWSFARNPVSVRSGCSSEIHNRLSDAQTAKISQFWRLEVQGQHPAWSGEGPLPSCTFFIASSSPGKGELALWSLFCKAINSVHLLIHHIGN